MKELKIGNKFSFNLLDQTLGGKGKEIKIFFYTLSLKEKIYISLNNFPFNRVIYYYYLVTFLTCLLNFHCIISVSIDVFKLLVLSDQQSKILEFKMI